METLKSAERLLEALEVVEDEFSRLQEFQETQRMEHATKSLFHAEMKRKGGQADEVAEPVAEAIQPEAPKNALLLAAGVRSPEE